jgi:hypothetical protein
MEPRADIQPFWIDWSPQPLTVGRSEQENGT